MRYTAKVQKKESISKKMRCTEIKDFGTSKKIEVITIQQEITPQPKLDTFKSNVDAWIKDFNARVSEVEEVADCFEEFKGNINHNYELSLEQKEKVDDLKQQIQTIKLTQLMIIKKVFAEDLNMAGKNKDFLKKMMEETADTFEE